MSDSPLLHHMCVSCALRAQSTFPIVALNTLLFLTSLFFDYVTENSNFIEMYHMESESLLKSPFTERISVKR